ncbi:MAG: PD-(D/E)XK nuclease family protein [Candidatus Pacebacteria bacterium]|nr:PD-(D/E)XK nuclease family protein [Candidatus Paceibacterota bacterium]
MSKIWISHTGLSDFKTCKKAYYYKHIYRNPKNNNKIQIVNPYLSLGSAVHETIEENKKEDLLQRFEKIWLKYKGKKGGFSFKEQEQEFKKRGEKMIKNAQKSKILKKPTFPTNGILPKMPLFKNIELVGSIDWIEVLPDNSLHIIDFKTGKNEEKEDSLQLFIYYFLAAYNFKKKIKKISYWYLDKDSEPLPKNLKNLDKALSLLKKQALEIKKTVLNNDFICNSGYKNCFHCQEFNDIFSGKAEYVGFDQRMKKELYYIPKKKDIISKILKQDFLTEKEKKIFEKRIQGEKASLLTGEKIKKKLKDNLDNKELRILLTCFKNNL